MSPVRLDDPRLAAELVTLVDRRIAQALETAAMTRYGVVAAVDSGAQQVDVFIGASPEASPGFNYPPGVTPEVGDRVRVHIHGADRYVEANLTRGPTGGTGGGGVTDHGALTGLADDDHPQYRNPDLTPYATDADLAAHAAGPHGGGGVSDHGALTGLGDDDHPQYATDQALADHAAGPHGGGGGIALEGPTLYTPNVTGFGSATFARRSGVYYRAGKMVLVRIFIQASGVGSGSNPLGISTPTEPDRVDRQVITGQSDGFTGIDGAVNLITLQTDTGLTWSRLRRGADASGLTGAEIGAAAILTLSGWYQEV